MKTEHPPKEPSSSGQAPRWVWLALVLVLYALTILVRDHPLDRPICTEDGIWFRGDRFVYSWRLTSTLVYRYFSTALFGDLLVGYKLPNALLHLLNAGLIYATGAHLLRGRGEVIARLGGFLAGWIFVHTAISASVVSYFSALAYVLLTSLELAALLAALCYFRRPRPHLWLMVLGCHGAALFTHSFALGFPLLLLLFELLSRRGGWKARAVKGAAVRYGLLLGMTALPALLHWRQLNSPEVSGIAASLALPALMGQLPFYYLDHLKHMVLLQNAGWVTTPAAAVLLTFAGLGLTGWSAVRRWRDVHAPGLPELAVLLVFAWCGMTYLQQAIVGGWEDGQMTLAGWRLYFNQVGLCLLAAAVCMRPAAWLGAVLRLPLVWTSRAAGISALLAVALFLAADGGRLPGLGQVLAHTGEALTERACRAHPPCTAAAGYSAPGSLSCATMNLGNLDTRDLSGKDLSGLSLVGGSYRHANLKGADAGGACLLFTHGEGADLAGARLQGATLRGGDLSMANLSGASGARANFDDARLTGADMTRGSFPGASFNRARMDRSHLKKADLTGASLRDVLLTGADLSGADLRGADLTGANLAGARLRGADLTGAILKEAELAGADMTDVKR